MSTRDKILKEAGKLFYQNGIHAVGMDAVCRAAGITKPTLYHHFTNKDDLVAEYILASHRYIFARYTRILEESEGTVLDRFINLVDAIITMMENPQWNGCAFHRLASDLNAQRDHPAFRAALDHKQEWERWIISFLKRHNIPQPESRGRTIIILLDGATALATLHSDPDYLENMRNSIKTVLEN